MNNHRPTERKSRAVCAVRLEHLEASCFHFLSFMPHDDFELLCIKVVNVGPLLIQLFELLITLNLM